ncbi:MAG: hypothetical protein JXA42_10990 [Anaerolineales bacterium]|nr:hypothetical protein [Anaerolineales bacterium]
MDRIKNNRPWTLLLLVGLAMLSVVLWLPAAIKGILSGPLASLPLYWFIIALGILVVGYLVLRFKRWARIPLICFLILLCLNTALQVSFYRLSLIEMLHMPQAYIFPITLLIAGYLALPRIRALFEDRLSVQVQIMLVGIYFSAAGLFRVTRILFTRNHPVWEKAGILLAAFDVALLVLGLVILFRKRAPRLVLMALSFSLLAALLWRFLTLFPFVFTGPMLMLMEGASGAMELNELFVLVVLQVAVLVAISRRDVSQILFGGC